MIMLRPLISAKYAQHRAQVGVLEVELIGFPVYCFSVAPDERRRSARRRRRGAGGVGGGCVARRLPGGLRRAPAAVPAAGRATAAAGAAPQPAAARASAPESVGGVFARRDRRGVGDRLLRAGCPAPRLGGGSGAGAARA